MAFQKQGSNDHRMSAIDTGNLTHAALPARIAYSLAQSPEVGFAPMNRAHMDARAQRDFLGGDAVLLEKIINTLLKHGCGGCIAHWDIEGTERLSLRHESIDNPLCVFVPDKPGELRPLGKLTWSRKGDANSSGSALQFLGNVGSDHVNDVLE